MQFYMFYYILKMQSLNFHQIGKVGIVEDLSVQLIKCYKGQIYINIQDKATSVIAVVPK